MRSYFCPKNLIFLVCLYIGIGSFSESFAQSITGWSEKQTNINDNLSDIRFWGNFGVVAGVHGLYYTISGINNASGWKRYQITSSSNDSLLLTRTRFSRLAFDDKSPVFYACGNDTIQKKAILLQIDLSTLNYSIKYTGTTGTAFNAVAYIPGSTGTKGNIIAVGNEGLKVVYNIDKNEVKEYFQNDKKNLTTVYYRDFAGLTKNTGMLSDSALYIADNNGTVLYSKPLETKAISGACVGNMSDFAISNKKLHFYLTDLGSYTHDSIERIKPINLTYNCITRAGSLYVGVGNTYIGTDSGIYKVYYSSSIASHALYDYEAIEYQPTSMRKKINNIWFKQQAKFDTGYAVGDNGSLLVTYNSGGPVVPYSGIVVSGLTCPMASIWLKGYYGSGTNCTWFIDNSYYGSYCTGFGTAFYTPGFHPVKYIVSNSDNLFDTSLDTIYINPLPDTSISYTVEDTILCKSQSTIIHIENAQSNFSYELIQESTENSFGYVTSSGNKVTLTTLPVSETGNYYIKVINNSTGCANKLRRKIYLLVEHTESVYFADKYNITPGEPVNYFGVSKEANSYKWIFDDDASIKTSELANPPALSYGTIGQKKLTLISSSLQGCIDTLTTNAVAVYIKPVPDDVCFAHSVLDTNIIREKSIYQKMTGTADGGYLICSSGDIPTIKSRYGRSLYLNDSRNAMLTKYTTDGVFQWVVYNSSSDGGFNSCATDENGNIYVIGKCLTTSFVHFSNGDSARVSSANGKDTTEFYEQVNGFIMKLDAAGKLIWHIALHDPTPLYIGEPVQGGIGTNIVVSNGAILVSGDFLKNLEYIYNGVVQPLFAVKNDNTDAGDMKNNFLLKIKDDGSLMWYTYFRNYSTNYLYGIYGTGLDRWGNTYVAGCYEQETDIYDYNNEDSIVLYGEVAHKKSYLVKFDPNGKLLSTVTMRNDFAFGDVGITKMVVDSLGNCYVTGSSSVLNDSEYISIFNTDGTQSKLSVSSYFLIKFNPAGIYNWGVGSRYAHLGNGYALTLKGNNLFSAGALAPFAENSSSFTFTSTNGDSAILPISFSEFFFAQYDTAGVLKRVLRSGENVGGYMYPEDILPGNNNSFIIGGNVNYYSGGNGHFSIFNNDLTAYNENNFVVKTDYDFCNSDIIVLPVQILSFNGTLNNNSAQLSWKVTDEINISHYNIQRSDDGKSFITTGSVNAQNSSGNIKKIYYYFNDVLPGTVLSSAEALYYRIEVIDREGKATYSEIIRLPVRYFMVNVEPNPNNGNFKINLNGVDNGKKLLLSVFNEMGSKIFSDETEVIGTNYSRNFSMKLASGIYFIEIITDGQKISKKIIVQ